MKYQNAKDAFDELKNFEGKATFKGEETVIDLFVLLPEQEAQDINIKEFLNNHQASGSFEIEGDHSDEYTLIGINTSTSAHSNDTDYFMQLLVW
jgi:hypothetical protein